MSKPCPALPGVGRCATTTSRSRGDERPDSAMQEGREVDRQRPGALVAAARPGRAGQQAACAGHTGRSCRTFPRGRATLQGRANLRAPAAASRRPRPVPTRRGGSRPRVELCVVGEAAAKASASGGGQPLARARPGAPATVGLGRGAVGRRHATGARKPMSSRSRSSHRRYCALRASADAKKEAVPSVAEGASDRSCRLMVRSAGAVGVTREEGRAACERSAGCAGCPGGGVLSTSS